MILLYGRPSSGKTTLARELVKRTGLDYLTIDEIRDLGYRGLGAQAKLLFEAKARGPETLIVECSCPAPRLADLADLKVLVEIPDPELIWRLRRRGWRRGRIGSVLSERYGTTPDLTVTTAKHEDTTRAAELILKHDAVTQKQSEKE